MNTHGLFKPELLLPAGTLKKMHYAFAYGADAVYAGQPRYSLRVRNNDFTLENLATGIAEARRLGRKFFIASNLLPHNAKLRSYIRDMEPVIAMKPDALIMADPGLIMMVRERWPKMPVHLSVQANTMNYAGVKFWQSIGVSRIILSRELALEEVEEIRQTCPDIELEVFVHGALCIAYSGRCLLSGYFNRRDPNQGACANSCRWEYKVHDATESSNGDIRKIEFDALEEMQNPTPFPAATAKRHPAADNVYLIEEKERVGQLLPIFEDEHGTYIMNSRDLRAVEHVQRLAQMGIDSLKIEGRTKSHYYAARTAQIYRQAIDDAAASRPFNPDLYAQLEGLANRGYTDGLFQRRVPEDYQSYASHSALSGTQLFVGEIEGYDASSGMAEIRIKNKLSVGESIEVIAPSGNISVTVERMENMQGKAVAVAPGDGHRVRIPLPPGEYQFGLLAKYLRHE